MTKKIVKNEIVKIYYTIFDILSQTKSLVQVGSALGFTKQRLNPYIYRLKREEVITKIGKGVWGVSSEKFKKFIVKNAHLHTPTHTPQDIKKIRGHAYIFTIRLPPIPNWANRETFLQRENITYQKIPQGQRLTITIGKTDYKIWLCKSSLVVYFPEGKDYITETATNSVLSAIYDLKGILTRLENLFKIELKIGKEWAFRVSRQHHSIIHNELAKKYEREKKKLYVSDEKGMWLLVDNSFNLHELEGISQNSDVLVDNVVVPFFNGLKRYYEVSGKCFDVFAFAEVQATFSENLKSHVSAIKELAENSKKQTEVLNMFKEVLDKWVKEKS